MDQHDQVEVLAAAIDRLIERGTSAGVTGVDPSLLEVADRLRRSAPQTMIDPRARIKLRQRLIQSASFAVLRSVVLETAVGPLQVAYRGRAVCGVSLLTDRRTFAQRCLQRYGVQPVYDIEPPAWLVAAVRNHLEGRRGFKGEVDLLGLTPFQQQVLAKVREIPRGEVRPYTWVAREIGLPKAVRAVGTALRKNPIPLLIPCHRVVRSEGTLGDYAAGNPALKERILRFEGVDLLALKRLRRLGKRFRGSRNTHIFCLPTCYSRKWAQERHTVYFASATEARRAGYRPCKLCRPA